MSDPTVTRSVRRLLLAALALAIAAIAVPLTLERLEVAADPLRQPLAWSAGQAWAAIVLAGLAGVFVALLVRPRRRRLSSAAGIIVALALALTALSQALPAWGLALPGCARAVPTVGGEWHLEAQTLVDGSLRDSRTMRLDALGGDGAPLLDELLGGEPTVAAESLGVDRLPGRDGGRLAARHCRSLVSGSQVTEALPMLTGRSGAADAALVPAELPIWRGNFDWWVGAGGELVGATFSIGGHPADAWPVDALRGQLIVELWPAWMIER